MIKVDNLEVGKRYWFDVGKDISGVFRGKFNDGDSEEHDYIMFSDIIKSESYSGGYYIKKNGDIEFSYREDHSFPECEITYKQLELAF